MLTVFIYILTIQTFSQVTKRSIQQASCPGSYWWSPWLSAQWVWGLRPGLRRCIPSNPKLCSSPDTFWVR